MRELLPPASMSPFNSLFSDVLATVRALNCFFRVVHKLKKTRRKNTGRQCQKSKPNNRKHSSQDFSKCGYRNHITISDCSKCCDAPPHGCRYTREHLWLCVMLSIIHNGRNDHQHEQDQDYTEYKLFSSIV